MTSYQHLNQLRRSSHSSQKKANSASKDDSDHYIQYLSLQIQKLSNGFLKQQEDCHQILDNQSKIATLENKFIEMAGLLKIIQNFNDQQEQDNEKFKQQVQDQIDRIQKQQVDQLEKCKLQEVQFENEQLFQKVKGLEKEGMIRQPEEEIDNNMADDLRDEFNKKIELIMIECQSQISSQDLLNLKYEFHNRMKEQEKQLDALISQNLKNQSQIQDVQQMIGKDQQEVQKIDDMHKQWTSYDGQFKQQYQKIENIIRQSIDNQYDIQQQINRLNDQFDQNSLKQQRIRTQISPEEKSRVVGSNTKTSKKYCLYNSDRKISRSSSRSKQQEVSLNCQEKKKELQGRLEQQKKMRDQKLKEIVKLEKTIKSTAKNVKRK